MRGRAKPERRRAVAVAAVAVVVAAAAGVAVVDVAAVVPGRQQSSRRDGARARPWSCLDLGLGRNEL